MQELIKIDKRVIGAEEINSVNARELWEELGIKKKFSDWMNHQINSLSLDLNIDYIFVSPKREAKIGSGGSNAKDYTLTLDVAKHIAMASRTAKGKEVRKYFIAIEKEYKAQHHIQICLCSLCKTNKHIMR